MKKKAISEQIKTHAEDGILITGQYVEQIQAIAKSFEFLVSMGKRLNTKEMQFMTDFEKDLKKGSWFPLWRILHSIYPMLQ